MRVAILGGVLFLVCAAVALAQKPLIGSYSGQPMQFKSLDTSKSVAPAPPFGQPAKKPFSLKSLVPSWLRSDDTSAPTSMRAAKHAGSAGAFQATQPFKPQQ